ncbi:MAG: hemolysin III family protein [Coriobacteriaceae bacterium]|nr:hemolysin III family protein [Coriobacteriaceae bacterium]
MTSPERYQTWKAAQPASRIAQTTALAIRTFFFIGFLPWFGGVCSYELLYVRRSSIPAGARRPQSGGEGTVAASTRQTQRSYSVGEEIANSVSHGVGALLSIAALVLLIVRAVSHGGGVRLAAALLMGIGLIVEYLFSTLYHAIAPAGAKRVFRVLDHCGIYLLIAGSYAPFALVALADYDGLRLGIVVWAIALVGIVAECLMRERQPKWLSALIYVLLGWAVIFRVGTLWQVLPSPAFWLLVAGGLSYTVGALFYLPKHVPYLHFVFHLFTLAGSVCITLSALLFVL